MRILRESVHSAEQFEDPPEIALAGGEACLSGEAASEPESLLQGTYVRHRPGVVRNLIPACLTAGSPAGTLYIVKFSFYSESYELHRE